MFERRTIDVQVILCKYLRALVDRNTRTVENTPQHVLRDRKLHARPGELNVSGLDIDTRRSFEHLHDGLFALNFENLTAASRTVRKRKSHDFVVRGELERVGVQFLPLNAVGVQDAHFDIVEDNQRSGER